MAGNLMVQPVNGVGFHPENVPRSSKSELKMLKNIVHVILFLALSNVTGGEKPAFNILSGNTVTVVTSR